MSPTDTYRPPLDLDAGLIADLYPIFKELITFCIRAGRTETNAARAAVAALRAIGVTDAGVIVLHRRYTAGS